MLRVMTHRQGGGYRLELHGTLGGEWVVALEQHWRTLVRGWPSARLTLDVANVDFIDPAGERLLCTMIEEDVAFIVAGCMNRYVVERLQARGATAKKG